MIEADGVKEVSLLRSSIKKAAKNANLSDVRAFLPRPSRTQFARGMRTHLPLISANEEIFFSLCTFNSPSATNAVKAAQRCKGDVDFFLVNT